MASGSLAESFIQNISKEIGRRTKKRCVDIMYNTAIQLLHSVSETKQFHDVTGNLLNSIAVGIYYKGHLERIVDATDIGRRPPTRLSLAKGEKYDLDFYYSGKPAQHMANGTMARPFVGKVGSGGQDGVSAAHRSLRQRQGKADYELIVVAPMQYAKYVERLKNHNVLSGLRDEMPFIFESNVVGI